MKRPQWPDGPEMWEESKVPAPPPKRIIREDVNISWNTFRLRIAWLIFAVIAIPAACLFIVGCIFGIAALLLVGIPVMIAPKQ